MKTWIAVIAGFLLVAMAPGDETASATPEAVFASFVRDISALATDHPELADFPEYVKRQKSIMDISYERNRNLFPVTFATNVNPVITKRRIRPSDCGTNGIFLQFILADGTDGRQAPLDTITDFPNLKRTLYADMVLWEKASPELKKKLEAIIARHKAMLSELDKKAANRGPWTD